MSKPDKPGELRDVTVEAISLVSKAANGEKFKIFKSAENEPEEKAPEVVKKDERGLFRILKEFFTSSDDAVEKGEVADIYHTQQSGQKLCKAFDALMKVLGLSRYDEKQTPETDSAKIISALDDFRNVAFEILLGKTDIEKSGRKISGSRLSKLKNIQEIINEVLMVLKEETEPEEADEVTKEEVEKAVNEAIQSEITPLLERIEKIESIRGFSNRLPEDTIQKDSHNDFWGEIF